MYSKMIRVSDEVHDMLCQAKLIPQEPYNNCLKRIIAENNYLKRHYLTEAPRESMHRDLQNFVLNPEISDNDILAVEGHIIIWNKSHPEDPVKEGELIHHINGDHNDNRIENLKKINNKHHGGEHKKLNAEYGINKYQTTKEEITFEVPKKVL